MKILQKTKITIIHMVIGAIGTTLKVLPEMLTDIGNETSFARILGNII